MGYRDSVNIDVNVNDNTQKLNDVRSRIVNLQKTITGLNYSLRQYNSAMNGVNRIMINAVKEAGSQIYDFTTDSIKSFSELSEQHAKTMGAMANNYDNTLESQQKFIENSEKLRQQAIDIAKYGTTVNGVTSTGSLMSPVEVSGAQTALVKAGIKEEDMLNTDVVSEIVQFATANELETDDAVKFAVSLGSQFGVAVDKWGEMLDKVSHTADMSIIDVSDIVQSMKYAGGITSGLNRSMDEVLGLISILGNYGLIGSQAGSGIQAFMTRLLTGDTTVITEAQAEVAPPKALEAFYDFSNLAKSGGNGLTKEDIKNANSYEDWSKLKQTGELRPMGDMLDALELTMESLNDEEQAWFAKKLFGLYQMKSAYALINGDDNDMSIDEIIKEIHDNSLGTNANKLQLLLESQDGSMKAIENMVIAIKTEFGDALNPTVQAVIEELRQFLADPNNYEINWDNIRVALDESCDQIEEMFGTAIAEAVRNLGNLTIDLGEITEQIAPEFGEGLLNILNDFTTGNFGDIATDWSTMIGDMNKSLDGLPDDLESLGEKIVNVIDMFGKLAAFNMATKIAELVTSVMQIAMMTINATSVIVNGTNIAGTGGGGSVSVSESDAKGNKNKSGGNTYVSGGKSNKNKGTGSDTTPNVNNTATSNILGVGGGIAGLILGMKLGKYTGNAAESAADSLGFDEDTSSIIGSITSGLTSYGSMLAGGKLTKYLYSLIKAHGGIKALGPFLGSKLKIGEALAATNINSLFGLTGDSALTAAGLETILSAGLIGLPAATYTLGKAYKENKGARNELKDIHAYEVEREARANEYAYMNGIDNAIQDAQPKAPKKGISNLFGLLPSYKEEYARYEEELKQWRENQEKGKEIIAANREQFYTVQRNYYAASGGTMLKYDDYSKNKSYYDEKFSTLETATEAFNTNIESASEALKNYTKAVDEINEKHTDSYNKTLNETDRSNKYRHENAGVMDGGTKTQNTSVAGGGAIQVKVSTPVNTPTPISAGAISVSSNNKKYEEEKQQISKQTSDALDKLAKLSSYISGEFLRQQQKQKDYNGMPSDVQEHVIENNLTNDINIRPTFTMDAPRINVNVTVKNDGTVLSKDVSILNPGFSNTLNNWYQKVSSQNGSTTK